MKIQVLSTERNSRFVVRVGGFVFKFPQFGWFVRKRYRKLREFVTGLVWSSAMVRYDFHLLMEGFRANRSECVWSPRLKSTFVEPVIIGCDLVTVSRYREPLQTPVTASIRNKIADDIAHCVYRIARRLPKTRHARLKELVSLACDHGFLSGNWIVDRNGRIILIDFGSSISMDVARIVYQNADVIAHVLQRRERQIKTALSL